METLLANNIILVPVEIRFLKVHVLSTVFPNLGGYIVSSYVISTILVPIAP